MDSRDAPVGVVGDDLLDDLTLVSAEARPSLTSCATLSSPEGPESPSVPPDHGFGLDDHQRTPPALPDTSQENPDHVVTVLQRRALPAAAEDLELMTKGDVLEDQRLARAERSSDQVQDELKHPERLAGREL